MFFVVLSPGIAADGNFEIKLYSRIDVSWNIKEAQEPIVPRNEVKTLNLSVLYTVDTGDYIADGMYDEWSTSVHQNTGEPTVVKIKLNVISSSSWCSAALKSNVVFTNFSKNQTTTAPLYLTLDENAPAYGAGYINIEASIGTIPGTPIKGYKKTFNLSFIPTYFPFVSINLPDVNTIEVNPMEQAVFPIDIENLGNARTKVFLEVVNLPDDWIGVVTNELTLEETLGSTDTAYLSIQPPKNFGYYDEKEIIQVAVTPARAEDISDRGDTMYTTFIVKSKGVATPGFEAELLISAFIIIGIGLYLRKTK
ncbi:MAG: hypothetical protein R6U21_02975, partial [Thermoplasmatota archaeon]